MFNRNVNDYVVSNDVTNHLQLKTGDIVTISEAAFVQLGREQRFWRTVILGGALTAVTLGAATGFVGIGVVGSEIGFGLTAAEIAAGGGLIGGTGTAVISHSMAEAAVSRVTLKAVPFLGKVLRVDNKLFSELKHVEVEFHIPQNDGTYDVVTKWVDAHHLMTLITKHEDSQRKAEIQRKTADKQRQYDDELLKKHRTQFAPENVTLQNEVTALKEQLEAVKGQRTWVTTALAFAPFLLLL